ncbi:winged helix-turn-helix transcriptional regulator [Mycobacterium hackensackense]|uniref:winged helix-turn-helix transcriptional regulator n=1 Tax=Mycobacterium hackensackense TaxID=228909 RepID=UPI0022658645|nr:helix-turn-helix domain-containing protein [Mycobacterium hackensackense]
MTFEDQLADRDRWRAEHCSVAMVLALLSTKTTFLVLRECFYGTSRFEDFVERIGTSAPAISRALKQLESAHCLTRAPYREPGARPRDEYRLTSTGEDLLPVVLAIAQWGDAHLQNGSAPLMFVEACSGLPVRVCVTADADVAETQSSDIEIRGRFTLD